MPKMKYHYSDRCFTHRIEWGRRPPVLPVHRRASARRGLTVSRDKRPDLIPRDPWLRDNGQMGSLAGAAYLLNDNAGVLNLTQ